MLFGQRQFIPVSSTFVNQSLHFLAPNSFYHSFVNLCVQNVEVAGIHLGVHEVNQSASVCACDPSLPAHSDQQTVSNVSRLLIGFQYYSLVPASIDKLVESIN